jgi:HPt (histidine-containing phosphotransfer) domain-containing protein
VAAYRRLLGKFAANQRNSVEQLRAAVIAGDKELAVRTAHSLKGSAGALGIVALQDLAAALEAKLGEGLEHFDESLAGKLSQSLENTVTLIGSAAGSTAPGAAASSPPAQVDAQLIARLALLQEQLEDFDAEAEDSLDALRSDLVGCDLDQSLAPIARSVAAYDMEIAAQQVAALTSKLKDQYSE